MCDHDSNQPLAVHFGKPSPIVGATPSLGSRRRRLWDLPHQCHCPVVGVCFPLFTLRQLGMVCKTSACSPECETVTA